MVRTLPHTLIDPPHTHTRDLMWCDVMWCEQSIVNSYNAINRYDLPELKTLLASSPESRACMTCECSRESFYFLVVTETHLLTGFTVGSTRQILHWHFKYLSKLLHLKQPTSVDCNRYCPSFSYNLTNPLNYLYNFIFFPSHYDSRSTRANNASRNTHVTNYEDVELTLLMRAL